MTVSPVQAVRKATLQDRLVGKWVKPDKSGHIEFFEDGTFTTITDSERTSGRWSAIAAQRVKISVSAFGIEGITTLDEIVIDGDQMTATLEGRKARFNRTKE